MLFHVLLVPGLKVIKPEYIFRLKIKHNDWLLAEMCPQAHVSASSQWLCFILSLRMNSSFITSRPDLHFEENSVEEAS